MHVLEVLIAPIAIIIIYYVLPFQANVSSQSAILNDGTDHSGSQDFSDKESIDSTQEQEVRVIIISVKINNTMQL